MNNIFADAALDEIDEVDCALISDENLNNAIDEIRANGYSSEFDDLVDDEEPVDTTVDYSDVDSTADVVDIDADDIIAAERDLATDPFGDDELIDSVIGDDADDVILDDEDL